jgi:outer membrane protein assembly factor BamB
MLHVYREHQAVLASGLGNAYYQESTGQPPVVAHYGVFAMSKVKIVMLVQAACPIAILLAPSARAENWNQFRGAHGGSISHADLPTEWSKDRNVVWRINVPGVAWSQPVAWGDKIFLTTAEAADQPKPDPNNRGPGVSGFAMLFGGASQEPPKTEYRWKVLCLDAASGETVWEKVARAGRPTIKIHPNNTYASETPVTDGERVIAYFGMTGVYCYDLDGTLLWEKDLGAFPTQFGWGTGSSPLLHDDFVYIQCDNDKASFLVALDKKTGEQRWRVERNEKSNWSTPYLWTNKLRRELVVAGGATICAYDPKTGELLWSMKGSGRTATTPTGDDELLYVDSYDRLTGNNGVFAAIRPGANGDISLQARETSNEHIAWSLRLRGARFASPILSQGRIYVLGQGSGIAHCLDAQTGREHYRKRLPGAAGFTASPLAVDGRIYCLDQNGMTTVIDAGPELNVVAANALGEMCWASPAVIGNRLLIRTVDHLYCIGGK